MDRSYDEIGRGDSAGPTGPRRPSDPIARNPKDVSPLERVIEKLETGAGPEVRAANSSPAFLPARPLMDRPMPTAAPAGDLLVSILRFKWTLFVVFVLVTAPILAAIWTQMIPKYEARAEVRVRPIIPRLVFRTEDNGLIPLYDSFVNTQVSVIRSLTVLQRVLDQQKVQKTLWYRSPPMSLVQQLRGSAAPPMERLRDDLSVKPRPRTEIIDVALAAGTAADAKIVVDSVLEQYMAYVGEKSDAMEDKLYRQLTEQYNSLQAQIQGGEKTYADLCKAVGTDTPQELVAGQRLRLDAAEAHLSELRNQIALLEWELKQVATDGNNVSVHSPAQADIGQQPKYHQDAEWRKLDINVRTIEQQIADSVYLPTHPEGIRLRKELNFARDLLRQRQVQLDEQWQDHVKNAAAAPLPAADANAPASENDPVSVRHRLAKAKLEEQLVATDLGKQQAEFKDLFASVELLEKENNALRYKRQLFDAVRERLDQKNIERNVPGSIEVSMWAYSPSRPQGDRRIVFTIMALALGLGLGGGAAFLRASRDQVIYTPKDMPGLLQPLFLGQMPLARTRRSSGHRLLDEIKGNQPLLVESVRVLRTALTARLAGQGHATVLVTSADEGTGKSSFVVMLGKSIADAGGKVLIIDADLRKKALSRRLDLLDKPGFMESLSAQAADGLPVVATEVPGLDIMPAGKGNEDGAVFEGTANGTFKLCMGRLFQKRGYDIVLFDTSPILPVADTMILAGQVDGTIIVERERLSRRTDVTAALGRLDSTGGRLLGVVLVGSDDNEGKEHKYRRYYRRTRES